MNTNKKQMKPNNGIEKRFSKHLSRAKSTVKHIEIDMTANAFSYKSLYNFVFPFTSPALRKAMKWNGM